MSFTVLGGGGVIGSHLVRSLKAQGDCVYSPMRNPVREEYIADILKKKHKHIIYTIGLTADFREHLFETVEAHVCLLRTLLEDADYETFTYLSSTRVYQGQKVTREDAPLLVTPYNMSDLYNISKLMGESLCLNSDQNARVVRISNVYGYDTRIDGFISSVLRESVATGKLTMHTTKQSTKDYVSLDDVVNWIPLIAKKGKNKIYNLASGINTTNQKISDGLAEKGVSVSYKRNAKEWSFLPINISRVVNEFGPPRCSLENELLELFDYYKKQLT